MRLDDRGLAAGPVVAVMAVTVWAVGMIVTMVMVVVVMMTVLMIVLVIVSGCVAVAVPMDVRMVSAAVTMIKRAHSATGTLHQSRRRA
jgi:hypothetical protein